MSNIEIITEIITEMSNIGKIVVSRPERTHLLPKHFVIRPNGQHSLAQRYNYLPLLII